MLRKLFGLLTLAAIAVVVVGGLYFYLNFDTEIRQGAGGVEYVKITPRGGRLKPLPLPFGSETGSAPGSTPQSGGRPIRIASFHLGRLDAQRLANRRTSEVLVHVVAQFDVVALQGVRDGDRGLLLDLLQQVRSSGRSYALASYPSREHTAFLFDRERIDFDASTLRPIEGPAGWFSHPPMAAQFRARGPDENQAFTFLLVNIAADPDQAVGQQKLLVDLYRAVRKMQPLEDDVILLGDLGAKSDQLAELGLPPDVAAAVDDSAAAAAAGFRSSDNLVFDRRATTEFTGRAGRLDLRREFNLTAQAALEISDHRPVWCEFLPHEGGLAVQVADERAGLTR